MSRSPAPATPGGPVEGDSSPLIIGFTVEGLIAVSMVTAFAIAAWMMGDNLVFGLFSLLLGCALVARRLAKHNASELKVRRRLPARTRVGQLTPIAYQVSTTQPRARIGIELEDRLGAGVKPLVLFVEMPIVAKDSPARVRTHVRFGRRGEQVMSTLVLQSRYPLGLVRARRRAKAPTRILVHPAEGRITEHLRSRLRGRVLHASRPARAWRGDDVIYGIREYREGDDPRRIHWRTTARRSELTVSEWRAEEGNEVFFILGRVRGAGAKALARFERAVSCMATLWRAAVKDGLRARLVLDVDEEPLRAEERQSLMAGIDRLARIKAKGRRRPEAAVTRIGRTRGRRTMVYVATGPEPDVDQSARQAAGRGGDALILRCDLRSIQRWVRGIS